jgi:hypothetical protein
LAPVWEFLILWPSRDLLLTATEPTVNWRLLSNVRYTASPKPWYRLHYANIQEPDKPQAPRYAVRDRDHVFDGHRESDGHLTNPHGTASPMAERVRRTVHRIRATRVPRSRRGLQRDGTSSADACLLLDKGRCDVSPDCCVQRGPHRGDPVGRQLSSPLRTALRLTRTFPDSRPPARSSLARAVNHRVRNGQEPPATSKIEPAWVSSTEPNAPFKRGRQRRDAARASSW